jgi:hypothetical protein
MDLGVTRKWLDRGSHPRRHWHNHRRAVAKAYWTDRRGYAARIRGIIRTAAESGVDALVFPACAMPYVRGAEIQRYRECASGVPWVFAGMFRVHADGSPELREEFVEVWRSGVLVRRFSGDEGPQRFAIGSRSVYVAVSSSIRRRAITKSCVQR